MKIEIKPTTIERIEKMGGTLTDAAINKALDIIEGIRKGPVPELNGIQIKPATIERIEKIGGTLTDVAINKAIDIIEGKEDGPEPKLKLTGTKPVKVTLNGKDIKSGGSWTFVLIQLMILAARNKANVDRLGEIFAHPAVIEGRISDEQHKPIGGTNYSIRYMTSTYTGHAIIHGARKLGYKLCIEYQFTDSGKMGEIRVIGDDKDIDKDDET